MKLFYRLSIFMVILTIMSLFGSKSNRLLAQDSCSFDNVIDGTLGTSLSELDTLSSEINTSSVTTVNGKSGSIDVVCTDAAININISNVSQSNNAGITLSTFTTTLRGLSSELTSNDGGASVAVPIGVSSTQTLEIDISATYSDILKPGNYSFLVDLEATP